MKRAFRTVATVAAALVLAVAVSAQGNPDEVVVIVNDEPIMAWEIGLLLAQVKADFESQGGGSGNTDFVRAAVQRGIDNLLMAQEARRLGIEVDGTRVDARMKQMADNVGGRAALEAQLVTSDVTYEQLRESAAREDLVQVLVRTRIRPAIEVSDDEIETFYNENPGLFTAEDKIHSRHILFVVNSETDPEERKAIRKRAEIAHARALSGENFAALAIELSEGPNAANGGDLGFTARGQMVEAFDNAVWALEPGEISEIVESPLGFHVIKVEEVFRGTKIPLDEAREMVANYLRQQRLGDAIAAYLVDLRQDAEITEPQQQ